MIGPFGPAFTPKGRALMLERRITKLLANGQARLQPGVGYLMAKSDPPCGCALTIAAHAAGMIGGWFGVASHMRDYLGTWGMTWAQTRQLEFGFEGWNSSSDPEDPFYQLGVRLRSLAVNR